MTEQQDASKRKPFSGLMAENIKQKKQDVSRKTSFSGMMAENVKQTEEFFDKTLDEITDMSMFDGWTFDRSAIPFEPVGFKKDDLKSEEN